MSARKPDAWLRRHKNYGWGAQIRPVPQCPDCEVKPLYALTDADLEAIRRAAEWVDPDEGGEAEEDQLRALAAALRSIVEGKAE